jgi:hypothetical protein
MAEAPISSEAAGVPESKPSSTNPLDAAIAAAATISSILAPPEASGSHSPVSLVRSEIELPRPSPLGPKKRTKTSFPLSLISRIDAPEMRVLESRKPLLNIRHLLNEHKKKFKVCAAAHNMTATRYNIVHQVFQITIVIISLMGNIIENIFRQTEFAYGSVFNTIFYGVSGILAAVSSGQNFGKLAEKHVQLRDEYNGMVGMIETVIAIDDDLESGEDGMDFREVLKKIEEMKTNIKKNAVQIPAWVQKRFSETSFWEADIPPPEVLVVELF